MQPFASADNLFLFLHPQAEIQAPPFGPAQFFLLQYCQDTDNNSLIDEMLTYLCISERIY